MSRTKTLGKKGVKIVKEKCTDKVLRIANIVATGLLILGAVFRVMYAFGENFNFFFMFTTFYFWVFVIMLGVSELPEENKMRVKLATYYNFLDFQFGKGLFMLFLVIMLCEVTENAEVVLSIPLVAIAVCNLIIGWSQAKRELPSLPWSSEEGA